MNLRRVAVVVGVFFFIAMTPSAMFPGEEIRKWVEERDDGVWEEVNATGEIVKNGTFNYTVTHRERVKVYHVMLPSFVGSVVAIVVWWRLPKEPVSEGVD